MRKILITGATGFIGRNLVPLIIKELPDTELFLICRDCNKAEKLFASSRKIHIISDFDDIPYINPEFCIHLAAKVSSTDNYNQIDDLISSNITFGVKLLSKLSQCSEFKLFINTNSFAEYVDGKKGNCAYLYAASKMAFRQFLEYYSKTYRFRYLTAVLYSVYGGIMTVKRIMDYIRESIDSPTPVDMTPGLQQLDFIHIDDVCLFYVNVLKDFINGGGSTDDTEYHIGTGTGSSLRDIASLMEKITGKKCNINWGGREYRPNDIMYAVAPSMKERSILWTPNISLHEGIKRFLSGNN